MFDSALGGIPSAVGRGRRLLVVLLACLPFAIAAPAAQAKDLLLPGDVPALDSLLSPARTLLDEHLPTSVSIPTTIGWLADTSGVSSPASAHGPGADVKCTIAVDEPVFDSYTGASGPDLTGGHTSYELEIIAHEDFHCFEMQVDPSAHATEAATEGWMIEGLARWVDLALFSPNVVGDAGDSVVVGAGSANAKLAYVAGDTEELQVVPAADVTFTP